METMTQENKELLLKDLCARLPYGVEVEYGHTNCEVLLIDKYNEELTIRKCPGYTPVVKLENCKPYLFPLSSMTEEQKKEQEAHFTCIKHDMSFSICRYMEWCYKNHLDVNGLIPKGLAIDATGKNIY